MIAFTLGIFAGASLGFLAAAVLAAARREAADMSAALWHSRYQRLRYRDAKVRERLHARLREPVRRWARAGKWN